MRAIDYSGYHEKHRARISVAEGRSDALRGVSSDTQREKMGVSLKIGFLVLWASIMLPMAVSSTKELLDCRANLTAAIRNDTMFMEKVRQADYIFTGKIKDLRNGQLHVRVKRAIKGVLNATLDLTVNDTCGHYIRRCYTGIFMARRDNGFGDLRHLDKIVMHFGPVPLTLANLDRLNAAVRGECRTCFSLSRVALRRVVAR